MMYRRKPIVVEVIQYIGENLIEIQETFPNLQIITCDCTDKFNIYTLGKRNRLIEGFFRDWIIRDINGEFSICKSDIFEKTYERIQKEKEEKI